MSNINPIEFIGERPQLLERYDSEEKRIIFRYWNQVRWTRKNGKMAGNIVSTELDYWSRFKNSDVIKALKIHMENPKYMKLRENYTRGILRNIAETGETMPKVKKVIQAKNKFHNFDSKLNKLSENELEEIARRKIEKMKAL